MFNALDVWLFHWLNQILTHPVLDAFFVLLGKDSTWILPLLALVLWLSFFEKKRGRIALVLLLLTITFTDMSSYRVWKPTFGRLRPCHQLEDTRLLLKCGGKYGMPSNHAVNFFALSTMIGLFYPRQRRYWFALAVIAAYSRVYLGKHFPGDVFVGALYGIFSAYLFFYFWVMIRVRLEKREVYTLSLHKPT